MMRWLSIPCLLTVFATLCAAEDKKADITAQVTYLYVRKPLPPKKAPPGGFFDKGGAGLGVTLTAPGKYVLGLDTKASKLDHFRDDKGTKLFTPGGFGMGWLSESPQISPEGDQCTISVNATAPPAKGALKIEVKGTVILKCGSDEKKSDKKEIAIKKNQKETVGDFTVTVSNDGSMFGTPQLFIVSDKPNLKGVEMTDDKGGEIKPFFPPSRGAFQDAGKTKYGLAVTLPKKMTAVTVKVIYFSKTEDVEAPLDLSIGVGLE